MAIIKIITASEVQVSLNATWGSDIPLTNVVVCQNATGTTDESAAASMANEVMKYWQDTVVPVQGQSYVFHGVDWIQLSTNGAVGSFSRDGARPGQGTVTGTAATVHTSILVKKRILNRGRDQKNGRMYMPAPLDSDVDAFGVVIAGRVGAFDAAFENWRTAVENSTVVSDLTLGVGSWTLANKPADAPGTINYWAGDYTPIAQFQTDGVCGTMRRRLRRPGS